jgi:hypothetical protein
MEEVKVTDEMVIDFLKKFVEPAITNVLTLWQFHKENQTN